MILIVIGKRGGLAKRSASLGGLEVNEKSPPFLQALAVLQQTANPSNSCWRTCKPLTQLLWSRPMVLISPMCAQPTLTNILPCVPQTSVLCQVVLAHGKKRSLVSSFVTRMHPAVLGPPMEELKNEVSRPQAEI